jgi:hypothetical protein
LVLVGSQTSKNVVGVHLLQEDALDEIDSAIAGWRRTLR